MSAAIGVGTNEVFILHQFPRPRTAAFTSLLGSLYHCILKACAAKQCLAPGDEVLTELALVGHTSLVAPLLLVNILPDRVLV